MDKEENELDYQKAIFGTLDLCDKFRIKEEEKGSNNNDRYKGMMQPYFDFEENLATYGFIGNRGNKIIVLKRIENDEEANKKLESLFNEINNKYISLTMNPFFEREEFAKENSIHKNKFVKEIFNFVSINNKQ